MKPPKKTSSDQNPADINRAREKGEDWEVDVSIPVSPIESNPPMHEPVDVEKLKT